MNDKKVIISLKEYEELKKAFDEKDNRDSTIVVWNNTYYSDKTVMTNDEAVKKLAEELKEINKAVDMNIRNRREYERATKDKAHENANKKFSQMSFFTLFKWWRENKI